VARNAFGLALLAALTLSGCSKLDNLPFVGNKKAKEAEAKMVALRARTDSLRKARRATEDSLAVVRHAACVDSVRAELSKPPVTPKKIKGKRKKQSPAPSLEIIATEAQQICEQKLAAPQTTVAASASPAGDSVKPQPQAQTPAPAAQAAPAPAVAAPVAAAASNAAPAAAMAQPDSAMPASQDAATADSIRKAKEMEMSRETFAYSGATRDPFNSLLNMAKNGPELADLQLVGIYQNLRTPAASVAVFREKDGGKRHKLRAGDQVGRSRLVQIRDRDVVFMIEDFGFERQETLSLRKQEDVTP
jgi:hypothetical protein